jgi:hypothetical protein
MERLLALPVTVVHAGHDPSFGRDRLHILARNYLNTVPITEHTLAERASMCSAPSEWVIWTTQPCILLFAESETQRL